MLDIITVTNPFLGTTVEMDKRIRHKIISQKQEWMLQMHSRTLVSFKFISIILTWACRSTIQKIETLKKINLKTCRVYCTINEKIIEFEDYRCASYFLGVTQSNIILILKGKNKKNPFNIRTIK